MTDCSRTPERPQQTQQPNVETVKVNQDGNNVVEVSVEAVKALFEGINKYNDQFSIGTTLARLLRRDIEKQLKDREGQNVSKEGGTPFRLKDKPLREEGVNQQISAINLFYQNQQILGQIGLTLEPVSGKKATLFMEDASVGAGEIRLNITDGEKFTSFLSVLSPDQVKNANLSGDLKKLAEVFVSQITDQYNLSDPSDEALQLFGRMAGIIGQYKRLGLGDSIEKMEIYLTYMKQGNLREYLAIEKEDLFKGPDDGWGPAKWQTDATPKRLREYWGGAMDILESMKTNPKAENLYKTLKNHLKMCVDKAKLNIPKGISLERTSEYIAILKSVSIELENCFFSRQNEK